MPKGIKQQIIQDFSKVWELNDKGHRVEHFENVEQCGLLINETLSLGFDPKLITLVAFFHDMFAWSRHNHHLLSAMWVESTDYPIIAELTRAERTLVKLGCEHHRASFTGNFVCQFDTLMNSADREVPKPIEEMIERAVQFRIARGMDREEALGPAIEHIKDKYSASGYARYPKLYLDVFGDALAEQQRTIANL